MKRNVCLAIALLISGTAQAATDHYFLRDGNHVHHLQITQLNDETTVRADVQFEPNADEKDAKPCQAEVSGDAKKSADNTLLMKNHIESTTDYCNLTIKLSPTGATVEQSEHCDYYAAGICRFSSNGKELVKIK